MAGRLDAYAEAYGMPPATLAAFAIAQWINQQDQNKAIARIAAVETSRAGVESMNNEASRMAIAKLVVEQAKAEGLVLDHEAAATAQ